MVRKTIVIRCIALLIPLYFLIFYSVLPHPGPGFKAQFAYIFTTILLQFNGAGARRFKQGPGPKAFPDKPGRRWTKAACARPPLYFGPGLWFKKGFLRRGIPIKDIGYILLGIASVAFLIFSLFTDPFTDGDNLDDFPFDKGVIIKTDRPDFQADVLEEARPVLVVFWMEGASMLRQMEALVRNTDGVGEDTDDRALIEKYR